MNTGPVTTFARLAPILVALALAVLLPLAAAGVAAKLAELELPQDPPLCVAGSVAPRFTNCQVMPEVMPEVRR